jgi:hypothetical protein
MTTAIVLVSKDLMNSGACAMFNAPLSGSTSQGHFLILPFKRQDERGVWLADIRTSQLTTDGSTVTMNELLVPWGFIYSFGIVDGEVPKAKQIGYAV